MGHPIDVLGEDRERGLKGLESSYDLGSFLFGVFCRGADVERGGADGRHGTFASAAWAGVPIPHSMAGAAHGVSSAAHAAASGAHGSLRVPWWNGFSAMIFLCWFGAAGYLLTRYSGFMAVAVLALARCMRHCRWGDYLCVSDPRAAAA